MKLREISDWCLDRVIETTLFEMANSRSDAIEVVRGVSNQIIYHLIYLYLYPNSNAVNHWKSELNKFLNIADDLYLKPSGKKKLKGPDYYKLLFQNHLEGDMIQLSSRIRKAIAKEGSPQIQINEYFLKERLEKILHTISYDLANDKFTDINDYL